MHYKNLLLHAEESLAYVTFNRPKVLNALNSETLAELIDAITAVESDSAIKAVIMTGAGEKSFIAGADIAQMKDMNSLEALEFMKRGHEALAALEKMEKPTIAAVNGFALGGGAELALACDFAYAAEKAKFGFPEVSLGIFPGFGGTQRLARLIGKAQAKELIYTGKMIPAHEACRLGMVNRVCPDAELMAEAKKTALKIASNGVVAVKLAKSVINSGYDLDLANGLNMERTTVSLCFSGEEQKTRMKAFLEKGK